MAARLTILVSQAPASNITTADFEESLVACLLMSSGMDATLIGPLERINLDSTDHLCISGFNHSLVLVSELDSDVVQEHWTRLGLSGTVRQVGQKASGQSASGRTIYHVPITHSSTVEDVQQQLETLLRDRQTATVSIDLATPPSKPARQPSNNTSPATAKSETGANKQTPPALSDKPSDKLSDTEQQEWLELDKLVDEFDSLDL